MFITVKNLSAQQAFPMPKPWELAQEFRDKVPEGVKISKAAMTRWSNTESTDHAFLSLAEGVAASVRVGYPDNPIHQIHGIIADYDDSISEELLSKCKNAPSAEFKPAWAVETASGHARLIWLFQTPVKLASKSQGAAFIRRVEKELKLNRWLAGFDRKALLSLTTYYEIGKEWAPVAPGEQIPSKFLDMWLLDASKDLKLDSAATVEIPIEEIAKEVKNKFPGRWDGDFTIGSRGVRFWDPMADNPTAAVVCPDGMLCFTGDSGFVPWRRIFGEAFVERFRAEQLGNVLRHIAYETNSQDFWFRDADMTDWCKISRPHLMLWLRSQGFSPEKDKNQKLSPLEQIEMDIVKHRSVETAGPHLYRKKEIITYNGEEVLNTSRVEVMRPAPEGCFTGLAEAREHFPWMWRFLSNFFEMDGSFVQLEYFLSWLKHFYESGYYMKPSPGHAIGLGGSTGRGKTFLITVVVSKIMGGASDATDFLVRGSQWTDSLAKCPLAVVDDSEAASDHQKHMKFSSLVKKMVANQMMPFNGKYKSTSSVEWNGRVVINFNLDSESMKLMPSLENSIYDKIALLRVADSRFVFPTSREETGEILDRELPYFCRFLLDWKVPDYLINEKDTRYFLKPYKHPSLVDAAMHQGLSQTVYEMLIDYLKVLHENTPDLKVYEASSVGLFKGLSLVHGSVVNKLSPTILGTALGQLRARGFDIGERRGRAGRVWRIPVDLGSLDKMESLVNTNEKTPPAEYTQSFLKKEDLWIA